MAIEVKNDYGTIMFNEDLIAAIAGYVVGDNYGIVGMNAKKPAETLVELIKRDNVKKGVRVTSVGTAEQNQIDIDLYVTVEYGVSLPAVAQNVQDSVRYRVEELTGIGIRSVNIHVEGIRV